MLNWHVAKRFWLTRFFISVYHCMHFLSFNSQSIPVRGCWVSLANSLKFSNMERAKSPQWVEGGICFGTSSLSWGSKPTGLSHFKRAFTWLDLSHHTSASSLRWVSLLTKSCFQKQRGGGSFSKIFRKRSSSRFLFVDFLSIVQKQQIE